jgi:glycosyltransferase involved in cell wall biosynthesis
MSDKRLTVSVIIPTYNRALLVQEAIRSLLAQTYVPDEIIVVDDGSTDNTMDMLSQYGPPVVPLQQPHRGRSAARNAGLRASHADLIAFLDSDDTLPQNSIERRRYILETHPEYGVVYTDALLIDENGTPLARFTEFNPRVRPSGKIFFELAYKNLSPVHTFLFRRECLQQGGFFDETLETLEDHDFWLRMSVCCSFVFLNEPLAHYHTHGDMTTTKMPDLMRLNEIKVQRRAIAMEAFQVLTPLQKARIYCSHGAKYAVLGEIGEARIWLTKSIAAAPYYLNAYGLMAFTLLGRRGTRYAAILRRRIRAKLKRNTRWGYASSPRSRHPESR